MSNVHFTRRGEAWVRSTFGDRIMDDPKERAMRFFEEACELAQACGLGMEETSRILVRTLSRPAGDPAQESAGAYFTLLMLCRQRGYSLDHEMLRELERVEAPGYAEHVREKHLAKVAAGTGTPMEIGKTEGQLLAEACGHWPRKRQ